MPQKFLKIIEDYHKLHNKWKTQAKRDKFPEKYNPPRLHCEDIKNLNRPITNIGVESLIKTLQTKKIRPDGIPGELYLTLK